MATHPVLHETYESLRFGRVLFVEAAPGESPGTPCRYCRLLQGNGTPPRGHFSNPESCAKAILETLGSGEAPERIAFGGPGDPLGELGIASVMRRVRTSAHLGTILFTDGAILADREARRDASEAETVLVWLPSIVRAGLVPRTSEAIARANAFDRHVASIAALRRESKVHVIVEMGLRPGENDVPESIEAWKSALASIRPDRAVLVPVDPTPSAEASLALSRAKAALGRPVTTSRVLDPSPLDRRCYCGEGPPSATSSSI